MSDLTVKQHVDGYFAAVSALSESSESRLPAMFGYSESPAKTVLSRVNGTLGNEEYNKFSEAVAADDRLNPYLPGLAISALSGGGYFPFDVAIDKNLTNTASRSEVADAAADATKFDAVNRKALQFVVDNFDKFRELNPSDGFVVGNNWELTPSDLRAGKRDLVEFGSRKQALKDMRSVVDNFETIDENKSGKITNSEVIKWAYAQRLKIESDAVPQATSRRLPGSEEVTKQEYINRMNEYEKHLKEVAAKWGLK